MRSVEEIRKSYTDQINVMIRNGESSDRVNAALDDMNRAIAEAEENHHLSAYNEWLENTRR